MPASLAKYGFNSVEEVINTQLHNKAVFYKGGTPKLNEEKCSKCTTCERICPYFAIKMSDKGPIFNDEKCFRCGLCVSKCPTKALSYIKAEE